MRGKERFLPALFVGALALGGCQSTDTGNQIPLPPKAEQTKPIESAWERLPAIERADRLELKNFPKNLDDVDSEIVRAISELYSQQMPIKISKEAMRSSVRFVDKDTFLKKYQESLGRPFLNENERKTAEANPEIVLRARDPDRTKRQIFINKLRISSLSSETRKSMTAPDLRNLGNYDLEIITEASIITHAFSHLNQSDEQLDFSPEAIATDKDIFLITGIHGLDLKMKNLNDGSSFELTGTSEAMTEQISSLINKPSNAYVFSRSYYPATMLVGELNKKAGIDKDELKDYYFGKKSIKDFLIKWGSLRDSKKQSISSGIRLYFLVASAVNPHNNPNIIRQLIEQEIGQKLSN